MELKLVVCITIGVAAGCLALLITSVDAGGPSAPSLSPPSAPDPPPGAPAGAPASKAKSSSSSSQKLAPCQSCRTLVKSFLLGMERTAKGAYGGGDTAWEEENKKIYKNSELRLVEIQESLCSELTNNGKDQCHELAVENEDLIEEWWHKYRNAGQDLQAWLCVDKLEVCCPDWHFGPTCTPCEGAPDNVCSGHGKCKGAGTRKGNGDCNCDIGYGGRLCDSCAPDYFAAYKDESKLVCSGCHKACDGGCAGAGPTKCTACASGWEADDEKGCIDLNECLLLEKPCKKNEFCVNSEGSHLCIKCDESCDGCYGDGPDMCEGCKVGYVFRDKICMDDSTAQRSVHLNMTRYLTYGGLCVATCIIFQKNMAIASGVGLAVAIYISASEYLLRSTSL